MMDDLANFSRLLQEHLAPEDERWREQEKDHNVRFEGSGDLLVLLRILLDVADLLRKLL